MIAVCSNVHVTRRIISSGYQYDQAKLRFSLSKSRFFIQLGRRASSISWSDFPLVSNTFLLTKTNPIKQKVAKMAYRTFGPSCSSNRKKNRPTKKFITQCTAKQRPMAFALIRLGNISDKSSVGTGPAPSAKVRTTRSTPPTERYNDILCDTKELAAII
uniref:Uncharacterized protein n=1 Tax=Opuntia streptacantha TaxID=393608 RepID=A0A7C9DWW2_OPUST